MAIRHHWRLVRATRTGSGIKLRPLAAGVALSAAILLPSCGAAAPTATQAPTPPPTLAPSPTAAALIPPTVPPTASATMVAAVAPTARATATTAAPSPMHAPMAPVATRPANLDLAATKPTDKGLFRVTRTSKPNPIIVNEMHTWTIHVEMASGAMVENATIKVDGDMPEHGHGLPTSPEVTKYLGNGDYLVEGLLFQMPGWWVVEFDITAGGQTDHVEFNLLLE
jgi:hypothetical protein